MTFILLLVWLDKTKRKKKKSKLRKKKVGAKKSTNHSNPINSKDRIVWRDQDRDTGKRQMDKRWLKLRTEWWSRGEKENEENKWTTLPHLLLNWHLCLSVEAGRGWAIKDWQTRMRDIVSTIFTDTCKKCTLAKNMVKQKDEKKTMDDGYIG